MAESFAGLNALGGTPTASSSSSLSDPAASFLDLIAEKQFPSRLSGLKTALDALLQRSQGTPAAMEGIMSPTLQKMAQQLLASNARISRTFGPGGGNQTPFAMGQAAAGLDIPGAYSNTAIQSGQQLNDLLSKVSIMAPQGQQSTETRQRPVDMANIAQQWAGLLQSAASVYGGIRGMGTPTSGTLPTTQAAYDAGGYANTAYAPFGNYPTSGTLPTSQWMYDRGGFGNVSYPAFG